MSERRRVDRLEARVNMLEACLRAWSVPCTPPLYIVLGELADAVSERRDDDESDDAPPPEPWQWSKER